MSISPSQQTLPVYSQIAEMLNAQPQKINDIRFEDIAPVLNMGLLNKKAREIAITLKPKPIKPQTQLQPPPQLQPQPQFKSQPHTQSQPQPPPQPQLKSQPMIQTLNQNHTLASSMTNEQLLQVLKWSDNMYYNTPSGQDPQILNDKVYDYVKRIYGQRIHGTMDKEKTMLSVSSDTGVGIKPTRERDSKLPLALRSLDNVFMGEGDVERWKSKHSGPYFISAKMDGTSGLYYNGILYTRGDATVGRNVSHILTYLNLPKVDYAVRGEIVIDRYLFDAKYKGKEAKGGAVRKINRNSVSGSLGSINNIDKEFLSDLSFVAYEIIDMNTRSQIRPSEQFKKLKADGFNVAEGRSTDDLSDELLSAEYHRLSKEYNYEVDGIVLAMDMPYIRESEKNPDYAKSFKEALANDVAVTTVLSIEWNVSQYGYLVPTIIYEPVQITGVTLQRATAHNAREVINLGLGPGAVIEIVYRARVNPQVNRVLTKVEPDMPKIKYKWVGGDDQKEAINIMFDNAEQPNVDIESTILIKQVYKFLVEIGAKGIGETTVKKILSERGFKKVGDFINMRHEDVAFLGKQISVNIISSISEAMEKIDLPTLMSSSKVFGRGLGTKKFTKVFIAYPQFANERHDLKGYIKLFKSVDGFADKTATLAAEGMIEFWQFVDTQLSAEIYKKIVINTDKGKALSEEQEGDEVEDGEKCEVLMDNRFSNKNVYITGSRDKDIIKKITDLGGIMQDKFSSSTNILVKKNSEYSNNKTIEAEKRGDVIILTIDEI